MKLKKPTKKKLYLLSLFVVIFVLIFLPTRHIINSYTDEFLRNKLTQMLKQLSDREYVLDYEKLKFNIFTQRIRLINFSIYPADSTKTGEDESLFSFDVNEVAIQLEKEWEIFTNKNLFIEHLKVIEPRVKLYQRKTKKQEIKFAKVSGDMYKAINRYLSLLQFYSFEVVNAQMKYSINNGLESKEYQFNPISFNIKNFRIKKSNENVFFTDDIQLKSGAQTFILPDSSHKITFDRLNLSTLTNQIEFYNLKVIPIQKNKTQQNELSLTVPTLRILNTDFERAYLNNDYRIKKIFLDKPIVKLFIKKNDTTETIVRKEEVKKWFNNINVTSTYISQANVNIKDNRAEVSKNYSGKEISIKIQGVRVDTNSIKKIVLRNIQDNYRIKIKAFRHDVPAHNLFVKANNINYSSITKNFECSDVNITPQKSTNKTNPINAISFNRLKIKRAQIDNLDVEKVLEKRKTELDKITLTKPEIILGYDNTVLAKKDSLGEQQKEFPYNFDSLSVKTIIINKGNVELQNAHNKTQKQGYIQNVDIQTVNISKEDFKADKTHTAQLLKKTLVKSGTFFFVQPITKDTISWKNIKLTPYSNSFFIAQLFYQPYQKKQQNILIRKLNATGIDYHKLLYENGLKAESVELNGLNFNGFKSANKHKTNVAFVKIKKLKASQLYVKNIKNDSIRLTLDNVNINAEDFNYEDSDTAKRKISYQTISASLDKMMLMGKKGKVKTTTAKVYFNSIDSILSINKVRISPVAQNKKQTMFQQKIHQIYATGFSPNSTLVGSELSAKKIEICSPETYVSLLGKGESKQSAKNYLTSPKWLIDAMGINVIDFRYITIDNGVLSLSWVNDSSLKEEKNVYIDQYTLNTKQFYINKQSKNDDNRFFYAQDHALTVYDFEQLSQSDSLNNIQVEKLEYSTAQKNIRLYGIQGSKMLKKNNTKKLFVEGKISMVEIDGIKPLEINQYKKINLKGIYAKGPKLEFTQFHSKVNVVSRAMNVNKKGEVDSNTISKTLLDVLSIKDGFINWDFNDSINKPLIINHLNLDSRGIAYPNPDKNEKKPQLIDLAFSFGDFEYEVMKGLYNLKLDTLNFDSKQKNLEIRDIKLEPRHNIFDFKEKSGGQKSRIELYLNSLNLRGFNGKELLYKNNLSVSLIEIDSLWLRSYKDKRTTRIPTFRPMPQEYLNNLKTEIDIGEIILNKGRVAHVQIAENGVVPGKIFFSELRAEATNITNLKKKSVLGQKTLIDIQAKLMGTVDIKASLWFNNKDTNGYFDGKASLGEFDARQLNNYLTHTAFVGIKSGLVSSANLDFQAYNDFGAGSMTLLYDGLHIEFLNKKDTTHKGLGVALKGFVANRIVFTKNPHLFHTKKGYIYTKRDTTKTIINYLSKLSMSGLASSVGVHKNKKEVKNVRKEMVRRKKAILKEEELIQEEKRRTNKKP